MTLHDARLPWNWQFFQSQHQENILELIVLFKWRWNRLRLNWIGFGILTIVFRSPLIANVRNKFTKLWIPISFNASIFDSLNLVNIRPEKKVSSAFPDDHKYWCRHLPMIFCIWFFISNCCNFLNIFPSMCKNMDKLAIFTLKLFVSSSLLTWSIYPWAEWLVTAIEFGVDPLRKNDEFNFLWKYSQNIIRRSDLLIHHSVNRAFSISRHDRKCCSDDSLLINDRKSDSSISKLSFDRILVDPW